MWPGILPLFHTDFFNQHILSGRRFQFRPAAKQGRQHHIFSDGKCRKQIKKLIYHAYFISA